jgi:hypothetical protein
MIVVNCGGDKRELRGDHREIVGDKRELRGDHQEMVGDHKEIRQDSASSEQRAPLTTPPQYSPPEGPAARRPRPQGRQARPPR